ncbi:MAG: aminomethyltransferase family protein [Candidatus Sericytochromatia bacterium]|nr:aminomethyltransferase family protein [Candidatus Tanganyikabacteria bacterium]
MAIGTPFHDRLVSLCHSYAWKEWAGYHVVRHFGPCHVAEYFAFRESTGIIDVTPLFKHEVRGPDAAGVLSRIMVRDFGKMKPGTVAYTCWCDDRGKIVDDGTVTRLADDHFFVTAADATLNHFLRVSRGARVAWEDVTHDIAALAVQGPTSRALLAACSDADLDRLAFFGSTPARLGGKEVRISRTGYTGDLGYEVWMNNADALAVWDALFDAGKDHGAVAAGLDALDVARVEAGFIMLGVDYFSAPRVTIDARRSTPFEVGLDWTVKLDRPEPFVGKQALLAEKASGAAWKLVGLEGDWDELCGLYERHGLPPALSTTVTRANIPLYKGGKFVGYTTSSVWSPILKQYVALASVKAPFAEVGTRLAWEHTALYERQTISARVVEKPFFDPPRKKGAAEPATGGRESGLAATVPAAMAASGAGAERGRGS